MKITHTTPKNAKKGRHVSSQLKQNGTDPGDHKIGPVDIVNIEWSKKELLVGESIEARVETLGYKDGTPIHFDFYETDNNCPDKLRASIDCKISGNGARTIWKYPEDIFPKNDVKTHYSFAQIYFNAWTEDIAEGSDLIPLYSDLNIKVLKENGTPIENVEMILNRSDGLISTHTTDGAGMVKVKKLPPRIHQIKFPASGRIVPENEFTADLGAPPRFRNIAALGTRVHIFKLIELVVYCGHKISGKRRVGSNANVFEVVPDVTGSDAFKDEVVILSRTATVLSCKGVALEKKADEYGMSAFKLACTQEFQHVPNIFSGEFWKGLYSPREYPISGLPTPLTLKCYRPDLYKLQIKFPALRKWSGGSKIAESTKDVVNDLKNRKVPKFIKERRPTEKTGWTLEKGPKPGSSELPVVLSRNGYDLKIDFLKTVGAVVDLGNKVLGIIKTVQDNAPKIGWYFEFEMQLLQGTFVAEWGWKEYTDHRAYYYVGGNFDFKIIDINFEVGIGVSGFSFKVQLFVSLSGSASLSAKISSYSPDAGELSIPFGGEIAGKVGARAQAGCFLKLEGTAETSIKIADGFLKFQAQKGWSGECGITWTGLNLKVNISGGFGKKGGTEEGAAASEPPKRELRETGSKELWSHEFWGPVDIGKWEWGNNSQTSYDPPMMPEEDLRKLIKEVLTKGDNIRVKTGSGWAGNKYMEYGDVAEEIVKKIVARTDLRREPKAMDSLANKIHKELQNIMGRNITSGVHLAHMEKTQFDDFLNSRTLQELLDKQIDPLLEIVNKHS